MSVPKRQNGIVAAMFESRGYGFIVGDDQAQYMCHRSASAATFDLLVPGLRVNYVPLKTDRGQRAMDVQTGEVDETED